MSQNASEYPQPAMSGPVTSRLRALLKTFVETDLVSLRVCDDQTEFEMRRAATRQRAAESPAPARNGAADTVPETQRYDFVTSDIVGIVHLTRPVVAEGSTLEGDRELAYVEALGIRNSVRSRGAGRIVEILCKDGDAVDYGRPLFGIDRTQL